MAWAMPSLTVVVYRALTNMKCIYKSYHPRENQLWQEVDQEYLARLEVFQRELEKQQPITQAKRGIHRRWYEKHRGRRL
jgi:hypothetical protein